MRNCIVYFAVFENKNPQAKSLVRVPKPFLFHRKRQGGIRKPDGIVGDFRRGLFAVETFLVGVSDIVLFVCRGDIHPEAFPLSDEESVFIKGKGQIHLLIGSVVSQLVTKRSDIVPQAVISLAFFQADTNIEAGVLAIGGHPQAGR